MTKTVGVLFGGFSMERPGSLATGRAVMTALRRLGYEVIPIDPCDKGLIDHLLAIDFAFLALHGRYGEDGKIQGLLETLRIPYTGSGVLASAVGMNKVAFKRFLISENIPTPSSVFQDGTTAELFESAIRKRLSFPLIIKPVEEGGSLGITVVTDERDLRGAINENFSMFGEMLAEEYIDGRFVTIGLLGSYRSPKVLPAMSIEFDEAVYDYRLKHTLGVAKYTIPANIPPESYEAVTRYAETIYITMGCHGPLRIDMLCKESGQLFVIEANTLPGLSSIGNLPAIAAAAGISYDSLIEEICMSAFNRPTFLP